MIPCSIFIRSETENRTIRSDYVTVVKKTLEEHLPFFHKEVFEEEINLHMHAENSKKKSQLIPLGVLDKDESKITEMIDIMESYHDYVPVGLSDEPVVIPLYGDGLSVERGYDAKNGRINAGSAWAQLQGLHPAIQEWHKRGILLQDTFRLLYSQKSARSVGTLHYIRNAYRQVNVKAEVSHCFNEATELLRFATEAYILATSLSLMGCRTVSESPKDLPTESCRLSSYLNDICEKVVDICFYPPNTTAVINANTSTDDNYRYCVCKNDSGEGMVMCDNKKCKNGKWFHLSCMSIMNDSDVLHREWYCSRACETRNSAPHEVNDDLTFKYTQALLWKGIGEMVRHRSNNGDKMTAYWKEDMIEFYECNHTKYFICGHRLLMDTHGALPPRMAHELKWNRTVNVQGGSNNNIEMDLMMEFYNKEFKG
ncbi:PREDICTED: uncharacterized protein LOC106814196 [Priapulus caudatus]|uniref:Uncharacterized protein LOC106814196 n=1 Tax=Priapulus caudatus TaxID=37621 RepID=A0ABM1EP60_PRICU|nr:PREDICTED: uncharacterized protein LOC106814196 [Priapulus caudatus]